MCILTDQLLTDTTSTFYCSLFLLSIVLCTALRSSIVLVTHCCHDGYCSRDSYCSCDAIVLIYYKSCILSSL
jgi:hypothetical protein